MSRINPNVVVKQMAAGHFVVVTAKDDEIATLDARIAELEGALRRQQAVVESEETVNVVAAAIAGHIDAVGIEATTTKALARVVLRTLAATALEEKP